MRVPKVLKGSVWTADTPAGFTGTATLTPEGDYLLTPNYYPDVYPDVYDGESETTMAVTARAFDGWRWVRVQRSLWSPTSGEWDATTVEWPHVFRHAGRYYAAYHGKMSPAEYAIGLVSADHPLGPWTKDALNPILGGSEGEWDAGPIAHPTMLHLPDDTWALTYWRSAQMGVATSDTLAGPWVKHANNPVLSTSGGWGGPVFHADGQYRTILPGQQSAGGVVDLPSGWQLWSADTLTGTWAKTGDLSVEGVGVGERLAFSIRSVIRIGAEFYGFGTFRELDAEGGRAQHIAAFASDDLLNWTAIPESPLFIGTDVTTLGVDHARRLPDDTSYEHPFPVSTDEGLVLFANGRTSRHMGAWVGTPPGRPLGLTIPAYADITALAAGTSTDADDTDPICLKGVPRLAVTATVTLGSSSGVALEFYGSADGVNFDTEPAHTVDVTTASKTWVLDVAGYAYGQVRVASADAINATGAVALDLRLSD